MKQVIGISLVLLAMMTLAGCTSLDGRNSDAQPWTQPFPREIGAGDWLAWPASFSTSPYEEQQWLHSRQNSGR